MMHDHHITIGELLLLVSIFVGPFLLGAGFMQFVLLRRARLRVGMIVALLLGAGAVMLLLTWGLMYLVPPASIGGYGDAFILPALIAGTVVTTGVAVYARRRGPAA